MTNKTPTFKLNFIYMEKFISEIEKFASLKDSGHGSWEITIKEKIGQPQIDLIHGFEAHLQSEGKKGVIVNYKVQQLSGVNHQFDEVGTVYARLKTKGMEIPESPYMTHSVQVIASTPSSKGPMILMVKNRRGWGFIQGGGRDGESIVETVSREVKEECGLDATKGKLSLVSEVTFPAIPERNLCANELKTFLLRFDVIESKDLKQVDSKEIQEIKMMPIKEVGNLDFVKKDKRLIDILDFYFFNEFYMMAPKYSTPQFTEKKQLYFNF